MGGRENRCVSISSHPRVASTGPHVGTRIPWLSSRRLKGLGNASIAGPRVTGLRTVKQPVGRILTKHRSRSPQVSQSAPSSCQPIVPATPIMPMDSFLLQASQALGQLEAAQATQGVSSSATAPATSTLPVNPTPEGGGQQQPPSSQPSIKRLAITSIMPASCFQASHLESQNLGDPNLPSQAETGGVGGPDLEASNRGLGNGQRPENWDLGQKRDFAPQPTPF